MTQDQAPGHRRPFAGTALTVGCIDALGDGNLAVAVVFFVKAKKARLTGKRFQSTVAISREIHNRIKKDVILCFIFEAINLYVCVQ